MATDCEPTSNDNLRIRLAPARRTGPNYPLAPSPEGNGLDWVNWLSNREKSIRGKESVNDKGQGLFLYNDPDRPFVFDLHTWSSATHQRQSHLWKVPDGEVECKIWLGIDDGIEIFNAQELQQIP